MEGAFKPLPGTGSRRTSAHDSNGACRDRMSISGPLTDISERHKNEEIGDQEYSSYSEENNRVSFKVGRIF